MGDQRDFGIAVTDAQRIDRCWAQLVEHFARRPKQPHDDERYPNRFQASPGSVPDDWMHEVHMREVARGILQSALRNGSFPIWLRLAEGEAVADPSSFSEVSYSTLRTGLFRTDGPQKSNLEWRPLWVKRTDWDAFVQRILLERYGEFIAEPQDKPPQPGIRTPTIRAANVQYDWEAFENEAKRRLWDEGGLHVGWNQGKLADEMEEWCSGHWTKTPARSSIQEHVRAAKLQFSSEKASIQTDPK